MQLLRQVLKKFLKISLLSFLFISNHSIAILMVQNESVPGGIAVIDFETNHSNPKAFFANKSLYTQKISEGRWQAIVGIPILTKPGLKTITVRDFSHRDLTFEVHPKIYDEQHITLTGEKKKYVEPSKKYIDRIMKERDILSSARNTYSEEAKSVGFFTLPVKGTRTSRFGLKRFYNGQPRRPHTGLDYAAPIGTKITSPASGKVILTGHYYFNGKTVFIDHGMGLISAYIHLNKINVNEGQEVKIGDNIGEVGTTGRSTGPHLHWGVYLNTTAINPELLMDKDEK